MQITIVWSMWHDDPDFVRHLRLGGREAVTSATFSTPDCFSADDKVVLEALFDDTNLYSGPFWKSIEPVLPENRSHTALSVGDYVVIDDRSYRCASIGWERAERPADTAPAFTA